MERKGLIAARIAAGFSQEKVAEHIGVARSTISQWERGMQTPHPFYIHKLCQFFDKSAEELEIIDKSSLTKEERNTQGEQVPSSILGKPDILWANISVSKAISTDFTMAEMKQFESMIYPGRDSMQTRRQILHHLLMIGSTALVLSPHGLLYSDKAHHLNISALEELEKITASYWRLCANASVDLLGNIAEHFRTIVNLLQQSPPRVIAERLCSLSGEIAQLLGKTLFDLREYALAWSYYMFSLKAAQIASNHDLWAAGIGRVILLLIYWEHPHNAFPFLQEVHQLKIQNPRVVSWLAVVEAEMYACLANINSCDTALKAAKNIIQNEPLGEDRYATGFSASRLAGYEGACFVRLHQPDRALPVLQQALSLLDPQAIRRQSTLLTDMGIAYAQQGNIQRAHQLAIQALSITKQTRSRAVLERICIVQSELKAWKETDEVKDLEKHIDATSKLIMI